MRTLIKVILVLLSFPAFGFQINQINQIGKDSSLHKLRVKAINFDERDDLVQALKFADSCYFMAKEKKNIEYLIYSNHIKGKVYNKRGLGELSANVLNEAIELLEKEFPDNLNAKELLINLYIDYSVSLASTGDFEEAHEIMFSNLEKSEKINDSLNIVTILQNISTSYGRQRQFEKSIEFSKRAIPFVKDSASLIGIYQNIAINWKRLKNIKLAREYLEKGIRVAKEISDLTSLFHLKSILATFYDLEGKYELSRLEYEDVISYYEEKGMDIHVGRISGDLGYSYYLQNKYEDAEKYLKKGIEVLKDVKGGIEYLPNIYGNLANLLFGLERYKEAFHYLMQSYMVQNELISVNTSKEIDSKAYKTERLKKEREIHLANHARKLEEEKSKRITYYAIGLAMLMTIMTYFFLWQRKKNNEIKMLNEALEVKNAEISDLKKEESHRTGNNYQIVLEELNDLEFDLELKGDSEALIVVNQSKSLVQTCAVIHEMLKSDDDPNSTIYVSSHFILLCEKLKDLYFNSKEIYFDTHCDSSIKLKRSAVRNLFFIVNELVTNASKHAFRFQIEPKINISLVQENTDDLLMKYSDNGIGLPEDMVSGAKTGKGLEIIRGYAKSLNGLLLIKNSAGTSYEFRFNNVF